MCEVGGLVFFIVYDDLLVVPLDLELHLLVIAVRTDEGLVFVVMFFLWFD